MPDNKVLPAVRVPTVPADVGPEGGGVVETPIVDLPPSEKFGFAWPDKSMSATPAVLPILPMQDPDSSEMETSEPESLVSRDSVANLAEKEGVDNAPTNEASSSHSTPVPPSPPRLSRAFSMPLSSQLVHLKNPHRVAADPTLPLPSPLILAQSPNASRLQDLSLELADSVQMVIQTLLQISPPHLLDPAKEQFSACSLSVPSPSISAMLTAMKNLNYMSANISAFADDSRSISGSSSFGFEAPNLTPLEDFDVGEMLQSAGDALSGLAAQAGVDLVLFHADVGMKHVSVRGDECGISYALSHIIRQNLDIAQRGDTIEIGLSITAAVHKPTHPGDFSDDQNVENESRSPSRSSSIPDFDGPLRCVFEVAHKFALTDHSTIMEDNPGLAASTSLFRSRPHLDSLLLRRLLHYIGGELKEDLQPRLFSPGRACELTVILESGSSDLLTRPPKLSAEEEAMRQPYANANIQLAAEPSLEELAQFVETLKGKKVALHASAKGSFAHHLSSYLTAWGLDVSHMSLPISGVSSAGDVQDSASQASTENGFGTSPTTTVTDSPVPLMQAETNSFEEALREKALGGQPSFILIDDDVSALRKRLLELRSEPPFNLTMRQRPKLSAHHRPKSSPQIFRAKGIKPSFIPPTQPSLTPVIVHFTSLSNYKLVKDLIYTILSSPSASGSIPEIIVLPKPAGPRRLLTALRTAIIKPIVDPFFTPIATSPVSPSGSGINPFSQIFQNTSPSQRANRPAISPRTASDRSSRSNKDPAELVPRLPPSPLRESDSMEYFAEAAMKLGTSPSSGLVIQSPDGQPAGIFFHPRGSGSRVSKTDNGRTGSPSMVNPPSLVRDTGNLKPRGENRRSSIPRRATLSSEGDSALGDGNKSTRPATLTRNTSGLAFSGVDTPNEGGVATPGSRPRKTRPSMSPHDDERVGPRITNTAPTPPALNTASAVVAEGSADPTASTRLGVATDQRKQGSPPGSPGSGRVGTSPISPAGQKRTFIRRGTLDTPPATGTPGLKKGKQPTEGNIVPPINVLIVEDNPINQTILSTFMKKKRIKYDVAKNGAEAVTKWKSGGFHLILMDIQMPVMDGIEATKEIRRLERQSGGGFPSTPPGDGQQTPSDATSSESRSTTAGANTPFRSSVIIVALTASSLQTDRVAALAAGCNDFLTKPVSLLWLNNKIIEWGSIKALQMWADLRPEVVKNIASGQMNQAKSVASKLHMPENRKTARSRSTSNPKLASANLRTSQEDAIRLLSTPPRVQIIGKDAENTESESDSEMRATPKDATALPSPMSNTESGSSPETSSAPPPPAESITRPLLQIRPSAPRELSGREALLAHLKDSANETSSLALRSAWDIPVVLGERTLSTGAPTIAEVLHSDSGSSNSPASSLENNVAEEPTVTIKPCENGPSTHMGNVQNLVDEDSSRKTEQDVHEELPNIDSTTVPTVKSQTNTTHVEDKPLVPAGGDATSDPDEKLAENNLPSTDSKGGSENGTESPAKDSPPKNK